MRVVIIILVVTIVLLSGGVFVVGPGVSSSFRAFGSEEKGTEVETTVAATGILVETVKAPGEVEPKTSVEVSAEVSAKIIELPFEESAEVRRDDLVAKLDDRELQATLLMSQARRDGDQARLSADQVRLEGLKTRLEFARRELARQEKLYESGDVSRRDYDNALEQVENIETNLQETTYAIAASESSSPAPRRTSSARTTGSARRSSALPSTGASRC